MRTTWTGRARFVPLVGVAAAGVALAGCDLGEPVVTYPAPSGEVATADLDADGDLDVVGTGDGGYGVLLNDGTGAFSVETTPSSDGVVLAFALGDVDGDGDADRVDLTDIDAGNGILLHRGDGVGGFAPAERLAIVPSARAVELTDVGADGHLDLVVAATATVSGSLQVLAGDGTGAFAGPVLFPVGPGDFAALDVEVADVDGDGDGDAVLSGLHQPAETTTPAVAVLPNDGTGRFGPADVESLPVAGLFPVGLAVGDVDEDGVPDVVTDNQFVSSLSVLRGNGTGGVEAPVVVPVARDHDDLTLADVDADGHLDVVGAVTGSGAGDVLHGDGDGGFGDQHDVAGGGRTVSAVATGDLDGDGTVDVVLGNDVHGGPGQPPTIGVLLNTLGRRHH